MGVKRRLWLNLLAVFVGVFFILGLEGVMRLVGVPPYTEIVKMRLLECRRGAREGAVPSDAWDDRPLAGRVFTLQTDASAVKFYGASEQSSGIRINSLSFSARKGPKAFRIFCFGGSTTYGYPYRNNVASFARWMQQALDAESGPDTRFEVINCGVIGMDSYGILEFIRECLDYEPDLFVVVCGHNEGLRKLSPFILEFFTGSKAMHRFRLWLTRNVRIYSALARLYGAVAGPQPPQEIPLESQAEEVTPPRPLLPLAEEVTPEMEQGHDRAVEFQFDHNLQAMVDMTRRAGISMILVVPCPNFRDWLAPGWLSGRRFKDDEQLPILKVLWQALVLLDEDKLDASIKTLQRLAAEQPDFSPLHFWLGRCYEKAGDFARARRAYFTAADAGRHGARMTLGLRRTMQHVAARNSVPFVDLFTIFGSHSPNGMVGYNLMVDSCHPTVQGHKIMAKAILQTALSCGLLPPGCRLDRFDEIMSRFPEDERLTFLPTARRLDQPQEWPEAGTQVTLHSYMADIAEWFARYYRRAHRFSSSVLWYEKAVELAPDRPSLRAELAEVSSLAGHTTTGAADSGP